MDFEIRGDRSLFQDSQKLLVYFKHLKEVAEANDFLMIEKYIVKHEKLCDNELNVKKKSHKFNE